MNSANQAGLPHLGSVQRLRKRVLLGGAAALVAALPFTASIYPAESPPHETIEAFGFVLIVLCVNFLGDGLRDALDPRSKVERG